MSQPTPKKDAVLAIGLDKPTSQIVAAAKARGVTVSGTYVDLLKKGRTSGKTSSKSPRRKQPRKSASTTKKRATPRAQTPPKGASGRRRKLAGPMSKSELIRSMPKASVAAVVRAARAQGMEFAPRYVSTVRYNQRALAKKGSSTGKGGGARAPKGGFSETAFRAALLSFVLSHGLPTMKRIVDQVAAQVAAASK